MKRVLFTLLALVSLSAFAQDIIICRNGDEIQSKVLKISKTDVEYKKWTNQDGPAYTIEKAEVFMIKYQNGDKDVFKETPTAQTAQTSQQTETDSEQAPNEPIMASAAANNAELIAEYNNTQREYVLEGIKKQKIKKANHVQGILGVTNSSILSTNDIEISFIQKNIHARTIRSGFKAERYYSSKYAIMIKNKTSRVIYIDKAACFSASSTGETKKYYNSTEYTFTTGGNSGSGATVNLGSVADALGVGGAVGALAGGVNVGGDKGKFSATTTTYKDNRILIIPPQSSVALSEDSYIDNPSKKHERIVTGSYEFFEPDLKLNVDELKEYTEETTPITINYMIAYSFDKNLSKCFMISFGVYLKEAFGIRYVCEKAQLKPTSPKTIAVGYSW